MGSEVSIGTVVSKWDLPEDQRLPAVIDMYADFIEVCGLADQFNEYARNYTVKCSHLANTVETDWSTRTQYAVCTNCGESRVLDTRDKDL